MDNVLYKDLGEMIDSGEYDFFIDESGKYRYKLSVGRETGNKTTYLYKDPDSYGQCYVTQQNRSEYAMASGEVIYAKQK